MATPAQTAAPSDQKTGAPRTLQLSILARSFATFNALAWCESLRVALPAECIHFGHLMVPAREFGPCARAEIEQECGENRTCTYRIDERLTLLSAH
jgi:hypothetical protein